MNTAKTKEAFEVVVEGGVIKALDENGNLVMGLSLADTIFEALEAKGVDCNGAGISYRNVR